ncbi:MAG: hypothetical protein GY803_18605 [Chloroflexi bacterium]|nr:hypothetical protein [Chloroflexota bacterium]
MDKKIILHVEDDDDWIFHVKRLLTDDYDKLIQVRSQEEATQRIIELEGDISLALIDISLVLNDPHDKQGFNFLKLLHQYCQEKNKNVPPIIILSGFANLGLDIDNLTIWQEFNIVGKFDKVNFRIKQRREELKQLIIETINSQ